MKAVRDIWKKTYQDIREQFDTSSAEHVGDMRALKPVVRGLFETVMDFDRAYVREKEKRSLCDFGDLEHDALKILARRDESGAVYPTELAMETGARYKEILVDEYQDVNEVQELIVSCLARDNVFMVGDVKQSIYRFRLADPGIFLKKYREFPDYDETITEKASKIVLSRNFRSCRKVLDAVNCVFESVMSEEAAEMNYTDREKLYYGAQYEDDGPNAEFSLIDLGGIETGEDEEAPEKTEVEASYVARRVRDMLDGGMPVSDGAGGKRPVTPRDIVILMRSPEGAQPVTTGRLRRRALPPISIKPRDLWARRKSLSPCLFWR
jgi:ATP-dependent helicase/nuclease subunit A